MANNVRKKDHPYPENLVLDILREDTPEAVWGSNVPGDLPEAVNYALSSLKEREKSILLHRYQENLTLVETGMIFGISTDRVRQIEVAGLRKLRHDYPKGCHLFTNGMAAYSQYHAGIAAKESAEAEKAGNKRLEDMTLEDLQLPARVYTRLRMAGYRYASELAGKAWNEIRRLNGFGPKSYRQLQDALREAGF